MAYTPEEQRQLAADSKKYLEKGATTPVFDDVAQLTALLRYHEWRYYILNDPILSDFEFDQLFKLLQTWETDYPEWVQADSPTQRVSSDLNENFEAVPHLTPMLSLSNSYDAEDLVKFDEQLHRYLNMPADLPVAYVVEPKFDGSSIALVYENDRLVRAATRGNGTLGEDITLNAKVIKSIPLQAPFSKYGLHKVRLRRVVVIRESDFDQMNKEREQAGLTLYANPRNTAAGGLRVKDPKETAQRNLMAFLYTLGYATDAAGNDALPTLETHHETLEMLTQLGFKVPVEERKLCQSIQEAANFCQHWQQIRDSYEIEIDGMVVKVNDRKLQERAGYTSHHPRWAIAYKFQAKQATTRLLQVEYQVGKIGSITPVAKLDPVLLAGVTVSSVSLHNEEFIRAKDLRLGDTVLVERAGDVIPYIVKPMQDLRDGSEVPIVFPVHCPVNNTETPVELLQEPGEAAWRCPNCVCGAQYLQRIIFHVSKDAMDIEGLGKSIVERFYEMGWIKTLADVYNLDYAQIATLEGFGEKSAANLRESVEKAKRNPIHRLLHSLSIHHLGKKVSKLVAAETPHVLQLAQWTIEDFTRIKDVGPIVAKNIVDFFENPDNIALLQRLLLARQRRVPLALRLAVGQ